jgi:hypothetical protein
MLRTALLVAMPVIALAGPTNAGNVCGDFTRAVHEHNDSLYEGFIYGCGFSLCVRERKML